MRFAFAIVSALAAVVAAHTPADTSKPPSGNPIASPGLDELVPVGKPYTISWNPTTPGKVSILLLRGPSTNVVPIATLADSIPNSGHFQWTPSKALEADVSHYGLQIIVEGTGQYQYSTQFGIKNPSGSGKPETEPEEPEQPTYPTDIPEVPEPSYTPEPEPTDAEPTYPTYPTEVPEPTYTPEPEPTDAEPTYPSYPTEVPEPEPTDAEPTYPSYPTEVPEPTYPTEPEPTDAEPTYVQPSYTWVTVSVPTPPASSSAYPTPSSSAYPTYTPTPAPPQFTGAAGRNSAAGLTGAAVAGFVAMFAL